MDRYVFDVDGTLTPSRQKILPEMEELFLNFISIKPVYLVTGSNYEKTEEQHLKKNKRTRQHKNHHCR